MEERAPIIPKYKVCILTAGIGSRLGDKTKYFNKALLRVGNKAVISHTIDQFPKETEFVIALGYKGSIVKQYLDIAHPDRKFTFVEVDKYSVPGSGPGYALSKCKEQLQCPFYFVSCDSIISWAGAYTVRNEQYVDYDAQLGKIQNFQFLLDIDHDWAAYDVINKDEIKKEYCTLKISNNRITGYLDKSPYGTNNVFVGVAYIQNYPQFWYLLNSATPSSNEEIQVAPSILSLDLIRGVKVNWFDTGSEEGLQRARETFDGIQNLDKLDEELYVLDDHVIKYFHNPSSISGRVERAKRLGSTIPEIVQHSTNYYKYKFAAGRDLFKLKEPDKVMHNLLNYAETNLWTDIKLEAFQLAEFKEICKNFYYDKTVSRLMKLHDKLGIKDEGQIINDTFVPALGRMFLNINWDYLSDGLPGNFHGDWNFSNIVYDMSEGFKFLDWRQDFGGLIDYGDRYYDFAKMYHSFLLPHPSIKDNKFYIRKINDTIKTFIEVPVSLERCNDIFMDFLASKGYDAHKVKLLTAIVLLNMSPLHEAPLDEYLYYYGKYYLHKVIKNV